MSNQQVPPELPEEALICDWLIKELGDAQNWDRILELMRALSNVRRLAEEVKTGRHGPQPVNPVPQLPARRHAIPAQPPAIVDGTESLELEESGAMPWETDPETM